jgi:hypothetical protein
MNQVVSQNSEALTMICTVLIGAIWRAIEKRKLRRKGVLQDKGMQTESNPS